MPKERTKFDTCMVCEEIGCEKTANKGICCLCHMVFGDGSMCQFCSNRLAEIVKEGAKNETEKEWLEAAKATAEIIESSTEDKKKTPEEEQWDFEDEAYQLVETIAKIHQLINKNCNRTSKVPEHYNYILDSINNVINRAAKESGFLYEEWETILGDKKEESKEPDIGMFVLPDNGDFNLEGIQKCQ